MSSELYIQEIKTVARYLCNGRPYSDSLYFINCGNKICNFYTKVLGHIFSKNLNRHQVVEREDLEETEQRDTCVTLPGAPSVLW